MIHSDRKRSLQEPSFSYLQALSLSQLRIYEGMGVNKIDVKLGSLSTNVRDFSGHCDILLDCMQMY